MSPGPRVRQAAHRKPDLTPGNALRLDMPKLDAIAPILWAKWGTTFLEALRQAALEAADGLAFVAMNSEAGIRTLLVVCTTDRAQIQAIEGALGLSVVTRPPDWKSYSVAEMIFKTERRGGLSHQERREGNGRTSLVLCATRPAAVRTLEELFDLPA